MNMIMSSFTLIFLGFWLGFSHELHAQNLPLSNPGMKSQIIFKDTVGDFVFETLTLNVGKVGLSNNKATIHFQYIGKSVVSVENTFTNDPHYICNYPDEKLISGETYKILICLGIDETEGEFKKYVGILLSDKRRITFEIKGES